MADWKQPEKTESFKLNQWAGDTITAYTQHTEDNNNVERFAMHKGTYDPRGKDADTFSASNHTLEGYVKQAGNEPVKPSDTVLIALGKLERLIEYAGEQDLDFGYFGGSADQVAAHNILSTAHRNILMDGNTHNAKSDQSLKSHVINPTAHRNLEVDGGEVEK